MDECSDVVGCIQAKDGNDLPVKGGSLVVKRFSTLANTLFARAQSSKVLGGLWDSVAKEPKNDTSAFIRA